MYVLINRNLKHKYRNTNILNDSNLTETAATLLGWVTPISLPSFAQPASSKY